MPGAYYELKFDMTTGGRTSEIYHVDHPTSTYTLEHKKRSLHVLLFLESLKFLLHTFDLHNNLSHKIVRAMEMTYTCSTT